MPSKAEYTQLVKSWVASNISGRTLDSHRNDFMSLKKSLDPKDYKVFAAQPQGTRNRYRDVPCLDASRVKLKGQENDYIHANYVSTPSSEKRFICTQGPTETTCGDFWQMVWQDKVSVIVMLCNFYEKQLRKCAEYYPIVAGQHVSFGKFKIVCIKQYDLEFDKFKQFCGNRIRVSVLLVSKDKERIEVEHYHWVDWPDRGVPKGDLTAISLLFKINPTKKPIVVHCSAGIGRTGTVVMFEYILELFDQGKSCDKLHHVLAKIREQRASSVQNDQQYLYVVRVCLEFFYRCGYWPFSEEMANDAKKFIDSYHQAFADE